jgi:cell division septal protein FtsQ
MITFLSAKKHNRRKVFDYSSKKLENPFFSKKKKFSHFGGLKMKIAIFICFAVFSGLGWFVFASSYWKIEEISFNGLDKMSNGDISNLVNEQMSGRFWLVVPKNNLLFFNDKKFLSEAAKRYRFQEIKIKKQWPDKIIVDVREKVLACFWNEGDKYYLIDSDGYVLSEASLEDFDNGSHPLISNESVERIKDGHIQADSGYISFAGRLLGELTQIAGQDVVVSRFIVDNDVDTIKVLTQEGVKIIFSTKEDIGQQIRKFLVVKREKLKDDFKNKKYIDLRFGDKIYFQ